LTRYYLDTSAHFERWAGTRDKRHEIDQLLGDATHATSEHARREWKRIADLAAAEVINAVERSADLSDVFTRLSQLPGRQPKQALRVLAIFVRGRTTLDLTVAAKARAFLRTGSRVRFEYRIDDIRDGSGCQLARNEVGRDQDGRLALEWRCAKREMICDQLNFISARAASYRAVGGALAANSGSSRARDKAMGLAASAAAENPVDGKGKNCYSLLGDVSIAMECGAGETLLATDRSFDSIAPALGLLLKRISPSD
jgi:hypothetical protein